jgi:hypothetical protein
MTGAVPAVVAFRYRERERSKGRHSYWIGTTEVDLRQARPDEAPVVVRQPVAGGTWVEYRAFDGRLFTTHASNGYTVDLDGRLYRGEPGPGVLARVAGNPFEYREPWNAIGLPSPPVFHHGERDSDAYREAAARATEKASRALLVGNAVYLPSNGPVMLFSTRAYQRGRVPRMQYAVAEDIGARLLEEIAFRFSVFDEAAREAVGRHYDGVRMPLWGEPEVLSRDGYTVDMVDEAGEAAAWHMVWHVKELTPDHVGREGAEAVAGLRNALAARWPGRKLDWRPMFQTWGYPHVNGERIPSAAPLLPVMRRVAEACGPALPRGIQVAWDFALDRVATAYPAHVPGDKEDLEAIADMGFR